MKTNNIKKLSLNKIIKLIIVSDKLRKKASNDLLGYSHEAYLRIILHDMKSK